MDARSNKLKILEQIYPGAILCQREWYISNGRGCPTVYGNAVHLAGRNVQCTPYSVIHSTSRGGVWQVTFSISVGMSAPTLYLTRCLSIVTDILSSVTVTSRTPCTTCEFIDFSVGVADDSVFSGIWYCIVGHSYQYVSKEDTALIFKGPDPVILGLFLSLNFKAKRYFEISRSDYLSMQHHTSEKRSPLVVLHTSFLLFLYSFFPVNKLTI